MALATRCPACETIFRISTTQAAAKGGMVRCGQCRNVFNSLDALVRVEDLDVVEEEMTGATALLPRATSDAGPHGADASELASLAPRAHVDEDFEPQGELAAASGSRVDAVADPAADAHSRSIAEAAAKTATGSPAEGAVFSEWWLPQSDPAPAASTIEAAPIADVVEDIKERSLSDRLVSVEWPGSNTVHQPEFLRGGTPRIARSRAERWMLAVLSAIAAIGLAGQVAYVWRNELAAHVPAAKPWLVAACAPLRCVVDYPAHLNAITIESTALQSSGPNSNVYTLTALLRNRDAVAIRYPYLELTLTDTQDRPVLRRALRPEDYLAPPRDPRSSSSPDGFPAESEMPVRLMFDLADLRFVGYRIDKYYP